MRKFLIGIVFSILPIYHFLAWIYVCIGYPNITHPESVIEYKKLALHLIPNLRYSGFIDMLLSCVAVFRLLQSFKAIGHVLRVVAVLFISISICIILYNTWGLM
ncbi:MAG: hypothetical protein V6Z82_02240 [Flavobacteriales bacterium]